MTETQPKSTGRKLPFIAIALAVGGIWAMQGIGNEVASVRADPTMQLDRHTFAPDAFDNIVKARAGVQSSLRDPASYSVQGIVANDDGSTVCIAYQARNGMGGMAQGWARVAGGQVHPIKAGEQWDAQCGALHRYL